jgi:hypothetical protein
MPSPAPKRDSVSSFLYEHGFQFGQYSSMGHDHLFSIECDGCQTWKTHAAVFWVRSCSVSVSCRSLVGIYCLLFRIWSVKMKTACSFKTVVLAHQDVTIQKTAKSETSVNKDIKTRKPQEIGRSGHNFIQKTCYTWQNKIQTNRTY